MTLYQVPKTDPVGGVASDAIFQCIFGVSRILHGSTENNNNGGTDRIALLAAALYVEFDERFWRLVKDMLYDSVLKLDSMFVQFRNGVRHIVTRT